MLTEQTMMKLRSMRLPGMANAYQEQQGIPDILNLNFDERFGLITDREEIERESKKFTSRLKRAKLREPACFENLNFNSARGVDKNQILAFKNGDWIKRNQNILITEITQPWKASRHKPCEYPPSANYCLF